MEHETSRVEEDPVIPITNPDELSDFVHLSGSPSSKLPLLSALAGSNVSVEIHIAQGHTYPKCVRTQGDRPHTIVITLPGAGNTRLDSLVLQMHDGHCLVLPIYGQYDARGHPHYIGVATPDGRASGKRKLDTLDIARIEFAEDDSGCLSISDYIVTSTTEGGGLEIRIKVFTNITSAAHGGGHFGWDAEGKLATDEGQRIEFKASTNEWYSYKSNTTRTTPRGQVGESTCPRTGRKSRRELEKELEEVKKELDVAKRELEKELEVAKQREAANWQFENVTL